MYFYQALALASIATALPLEVATRQLDRTSLTENEFSRSLSCAKVVFVWARGSTEAGNMVCAGTSNSALSPDSSNEGERDLSLANHSATNSARSMDETSRLKVSTTQPSYLPITFLVAQTWSPSWR
jgi:hypothetical protein